MKTKVFEKILLKNSDFKDASNESIKDIIDLKNNLRKDLLEFFRKAYVRWYQAIHKEKIKEQSRIASKKRYHENPEYRFKKNDWRN